jgi:hypothetical protein
MAISPQGFLKRREDAGYSPEEYAKSFGKVGD